MPRPLRIHCPNGFYHATLRGNHRQDIFGSDGDRHLLNKIVARALEKHGVRLHAYCWMTNHLHFLLQVGQQPLAGVMQQMASEYARAFQADIKTTGHLFEQRYHATLVDVDAYLLTLLRYIHLNPVRAGLAARASDYRWSSHHAYAARGGEAWVTTDFALNMFSADRPRAIAAYKRFIENDVPELAQDPMSEALERGALVLGSEKFIAQMAGKLGDRSVNAGLTQLIDEASRRFGVNPDQLRSPRRDEKLVRARAWIANCARVHGIATLSSVARALRRDESTLRNAVERYADQAHEDSDDQTPTIPT